jgi:hypothetical protein
MILGIDIGVTGGIAVLSALIAIAGLGRERAP